MSDEDQDKNIDDVLELLSKPLSRYILAILAGVDPGSFKGSLNGDNNDHPDEADASF